MTRKSSHTLLCLQPHATGAVYVLRIKFNLKVLSPELDGVVQLLKTFEFALSTYSRQWP